MVHYMDLSTLRALYEDRFTYLDNPEPHHFHFRTLILLHTQTFGLRGMK